MRGERRGGNFKFTFVEKFISEKLTAFRVFLPNKKNAACILQYKIIRDLKYCCISPLLCPLGRESDDDVFKWLNREKTILSDVVASTINFA
jgi:hypothetical protein